MNNTDAEGRLILADALTHSVRELGAQRLVDIATLTGGVIVALGSTYAGLLANDDEWAERVEEAGQRTGELAWRLPLHPEYKDLTRGTVRRPHQQLKQAQGIVDLRGRVPGGVRRRRARGCTWTSPAPRGTWAART